MRRRMSDLGVVGQHAVGVEIPRLYGEALAEMKSGTPPGDPAVRRIASRLDELSALLRGGTDSGASAAVRALWADRAGGCHPATAAPTGASLSLPGPGPLRPLTDRRPETTCIWTIGIPKKRNEDDDHHDRAPHVAGGDPPRGGGGGAAR